MLDINIYNSIYDWTKNKLAHSFKANKSNVDVYQEIMPPNKSQAIVISKNSFGNILEAYIDGTSLKSSEVSVVALQKLASYSEDELIAMVVDLENAIRDMLEAFQNNDKPKLQTGYEIKDIEVGSSSSLKAFDINTVVYSIELIFKIHCKK